MAAWSFWIFTTAVIWFAIFLTYFMPVKKEFIGISTPETVLEQSGSLVPGVSPLKRHYNKTVLVLIDALRADFLFSPGTPMSMTKKLVSQNLALVAKAHTPTVTLPRIKALMTGSVPGFVDVILNFGSTKYEGDNILAQMSRAGRRVVFFGDDTWIKLFSDHFTRYEGTTSFFVTDYTEVDNNVTRHLPLELSAGDFDLLILHYLGLDHIGHLAGPNSPLVPPKLREMDEVIDTVYRSLTKLQGEGLPNLLIVCGDHGMSDQGSHGGASYSETRVPLAFLSTQHRSSTGGVVESEVDQIDLVPTLSELLGLPIPSNNLGHLLMDMVQEQGAEEQLASLLRNTIQLLNLLREDQPGADSEVRGFFHSTCQLHSKWLSLTPQERSSAMAHQIQIKYNEVITMATSTITKKLTTYDIPALITCVIGLWTAAILLLLSQQSPVRWVVMVHVISTLYLVGHLTQFQSVWPFSGSGYLISVASLMLVLSTIALQAKKTMKDQVLEWMRSSFCGGGSLCGGFLIAGTLLHTVSLLSSSYVEEEHQTWYFLSTSIHILHLMSVILTMNTNQHPCNASFNSSTSNHFLRSCPKSDVESDQGSHSDKVRQEVLNTAVLLLAARLMRSWNQTGNKWLHLPDIGDWLILADNRTLLSVLVAVSLLLILVLQSRRLTWVQTILSAAGLFCVFWSRASTGALFLPFVPQVDRGILPARLSFLCVFLVLVSQFLPGQTSRSSVGHMDICLTAWTVLHVLLMRPHNTVLVAFMTVQQSVLCGCKLVLSPSAAAVFYVWMGRAAFFSQGNSNSIATVDVGAGYVGQEDYNAFPVAFLLGLATYAGPIYWFMAFLAKLNTLNPSHRDLHQVYFTVAVTCLLPMVVYAAFVVTERYHLFVWTVFLPKLLYLGMDLVIYYLLSVILVLKYYLRCE